MSDKTKEDADMLANLDLLLNMDAVDSEADWSMLSTGGTDAMPDDLSDLGDDKSGGGQ